MAKILIVDDDRLNTQIYATKLKSENHQVDLCLDGESAKEMIKQQYNFILLDFMMPKLDGLQVLQLIRSGVNKKTPVVINTSLVDIKTKDECLKAGANDYWQKYEISPGQLLEKIKQYL